MEAVHPRDQRVSPRRAAAAAAARSSSSATKETLLPGAAEQSPEILPRLLPLSTQLRRLWKRSSGGGSSNAVGSADTWVILGLPEHGASALVYRMKLHDFISTVRTNATVYETFKLKFTCVRHRFTRGGLPPLTTPVEENFSSCQYVEKRVHTVDVGRFVRYAKKHSGFSLLRGGRSVRELNDFSSFYCKSPRTAPAGLEHQQQPSERANGLALAARKHTHKASALLIVIDATQLTEEVLHFWRSELCWLRVGLARLAVVLTKCDLLPPSGGARGWLLSGAALGLPPNERKIKWEILHVSSKTGAGFSQLCGWLLFPSRCVVSPEDEQRERRFALLNCPEPLPDLERTAMTTMTIDLPIGEGSLEKEGDDHAERVVDYDEEEDAEERGRNLGGELSENDLAARGGLTTGPWLHGCKFQLIPNGMDFDRFNFDLAEASRLATGQPLVPRKCPSTASHLGGLLAASPKLLLMKMSLPPQPPQPPRSTSITPPTVFGKTTTPEASDRGEVLGEDLL